MLQLTGEIFPLNISFSDSCNKLDMTRQREPSVSNASGEDEEAFGYLSLEVDWRWFLQMSRFNDRINPEHAERDHDSGFVCVKEDEVLLSSVGLFSFLRQQNSLKIVLKN